MGREPTIRPNYQIVFKVGGLKVYGDKFVYECDAKDALEELDLVNMRYGLPKLYSIEKV